MKLIARLRPDYFAYFSIIAACLLITFGGCQNPIGPIRATTFPPDLVYMPKERIKTAMWVLAAEIQQLEKVLDQQTRAESPSQQRLRQHDVGQSLERMSVAARTLDEPGRKTQHPVINHNLGRFRERIERAKRAAEREPPNYFQASSLAGSCFLCHGTAKAGASVSERRG